MPPARPVLVLAAALLLAAPALAVDRNNFKKCSDSGFCRRLRDRPAGASSFSVVADSIRETAGGIVMDIRDSNEAGLLELTLSVVGRESARVHITEKSPKFPRYEVQGVLPEQLARHPLSVKEKDSESLVATFASGHAVAVTYQPFRIDFLVDGAVAVSLNSAGLMAFEQYRDKREGDVDGMWEENFKTHADSKPRGPSALAMDVSFAACDNVYGIPEHSSSLSLPPTRGEGVESDPYRLYNLDVFEYEIDNPMALYGSIPYMIAHSAARTSGVFWLNAAEMWIDVEKTSSGSAGIAGGVMRKLKSLFARDVESKPAPQVNTHWMAESGVIDMFVFLGNKPQDVFAQYAALTGTTALPPLFSIAYHQCRWNYNDEADVALVEEKMDEHDIPFDVIWLDIEHTDGKRYMTWDTSKFPTPKDMQDKLTVRGRKMVNIVDPHIKRAAGYHIHEEAERQGLYIKNKDGKDYDGWCWPGSSSWLDFMDPKIQDWWADQFAFDKYQGTTPSMYFWNDMNEPSVFNGPEITMHKDAKHYGDFEHRDVHNIYGMWQHAATGVGIKKRSGGVERPFVLSRAFFAGTQKYGAIWTGDNTAEWSHLKASMPMLMSINLAGLSFSGADIGGFFKNPDSQLLIRWYQAGAYQPFMRAHAHLDTKRREPYLFEASEMELMRSAVRARYALLPYWYTCFYDASITGNPIMRPLWVEYPKDEETFQLETEYLVGTDLLVAPVTEANANTASVYFPGAQPWYDVETFQKHSAPARKTVAAPLRKIPVYQRGGSIIPRKERIRRSSSLTHNDPFTLVAALDSERSAQGLLYVDDYHTNNFAGGKALVREFSISPEGNSLVFTSASKFKGDFASKEWIERIVVLGMTSKPSAVQVRGGAALRFVYSADEQRLEIKKPADNIASDFVVDIKL